MRKNETTRMGSMPGRSADSVRLEGDLSARDAASVHQSVLAALQRNESVEIDSRALSSIDTTIVQVLLAAQKSALRLGHTLSVTGEPGGVLSGTLERLGLPANALD